MLSHYYGIFITRVRLSLAYRFNYIVRVLASFISLFIIWYIWKAIFESSGGNIIGSFTFPEMMTYMSLSVIFSTLMMTFQEYDIQKDIRSGSIAIYLTKPISYPLVSFFRTIGSKFTGLFTQLLPIIVVALAIIHIASPHSWLFLLSLFLSYLINYIMVFLTGLTSFWTKGDIWGIRLSRIVVGNILSGSLLPISLFPAWLAGIANILPFVTLFHIPASIYIGRITGAEVFSSLALQISWLIILILISFVMWKRAKKKIFIQGG